MQSKRGNKPSGSQSGARFLGALDEMRRELARELDADGAPLVSSRWSYSEHPAEVLCMRLGGADITAGRIVAEAIRAGGFRNVLRFFAGAVRGAALHWNRPERSGDKRRWFVRDDSNYRGSNDEGPSETPKDKRTTIAVASERMRALELTGLAEGLTTELLEDSNSQVVMCHAYLRDHEDPEPIIAAGLLTVMYAWDCRFAPDEPICDVPERTPTNVGEMYTREVMRALLVAGELSGRPFDVDAFVAELRAAVPTIRPARKGKGARSRVVPLRRAG